MYNLLSRTHYINQVVTLLVAVSLCTLGGGAVVYAMSNHSPVIVYKPVSAGVALPNQQQLMDKGSVERPYIGVTYQPITPQIVQEHGLQATEGDVLSQVANNSPATKAGLQTGDVIIAVDGQTVDDEHPLTAALIGRAPGDTIKLQVQRGGKVSSVTLTLGVRPSDGSN